MNMNLMGTPAPPPMCLEVGPYKFKVHFVKPPFPASDPADAEGNYGLSDFKTLDIYIDNSVATMLQVDTLVHEMLHCIAMVNGLQNEWGSREERYVSTIAPFLCMVLRDNPDFVSFVTDND